MWDKRKANAKNGLEQWYDYTDMLGFCAWLHILVRKHKEVAIACMAQSVNVVSVIHDAGSVELTVDFAINDQPRWCLQTNDILSVSSLVAVRGGKQLIIQTSAVFKLHEEWQAVSYSLAARRVHRPDLPGTYPDDGDETVLYRLCRYRRRYRPRNKYPSQHTEPAPQGRLESENRYPRFWQVDL